MPQNQKRVLIVGGGFGGVAAALTLEKRHSDGVKITLVSNKPHFEYYAGLYRVVTGKSPLEVCVPLTDILRGKKIELVIDTITGVNLEKKIAPGASGAHYQFDYLVLALGSETAYFNIPGLERFSFGFKSITEALKLKRHLHQVFEACADPQTSAEQKINLLHFVVVGAGASGVELSGELAAYTKKLARHHRVDESLITIELIEAAPRILPMFSPAVTKVIANRLRQLGVNIFTNRAMIKEEIEEISVRGMTMKTETVIWTAGIKPNNLYQKISGLAFDKKGRVLVDEYLQAKGLNSVFVIGDGASTAYSGMAQTAILDSKHVASNIIRLIRNRSSIKYRPKRPYYSIPVGSGWAATLMGPITLYGTLGWFFRRLADLRYFLSILPFNKALTAFQSGKTLCESCAICTPETK